MALNCVGGRSSLNLSKTLDDDGCMVTYGGMSKQPVQSPTGSFIFKDIALRGFWMSHWYTKKENFQVRNDGFGATTPGKGLASGQPKLSKTELKCFLNERLSKKEY